MTNDNIRYRFKFEKYGNAKFIGHLDVMRAFQRAFKRADINISYSNGFNPHQLVSFALPLSLGYTSTGEYGDFQLYTEENADELIKDINSSLPEGLKITRIVKLREGVKNTMSSVCAASYNIYFDKTVSSYDIENNIYDFFGKDDIFVDKKTKNSLKRTDIKLDIINIEYTGERVLKTLVNAGSVRNLKPDLIAEAFMDFLDIDYNKYSFGFRRNDMYMKDNNGGLVSLIDGVGE